MYASQSQTANGLTRFRSAPSSFLESLVRGTGDEFHPPPVPENLIGRFFSGDSSCLTSESSCQVAVSATPDLEEIGPSRSDARPPQPPPLTSSEDNTKKTQGFGVAGFRESEIAFPSGGSNGGGGGGDRFQHLGHVGVSDFNASGNYRGPLTRHSSSPAGFFTNLNLENGYSLGGAINGNFSLDSSSSGQQQHRMAQRRLKSQLSFSRRDSPKSLFSQLSDLSSMAEVGANSSSDDSLGCDANGNKSYISTGFPLGSWDDESHPVVFGGGPKKRNRDLNSDHIMHGLTDSQFELSNSSLEMTSMEKFMQMQQDSVPCKIRAKRGCATHPRSIAERERRTRISEKLRKLQELVPNMDKQTNTADMLDLAVSYIKTLQNDVQKLTQERADCRCAIKQDGKS